MALRSNLNIEIRIDDDRWPDESELRQIVVHATDAAVIIGELAFEDDAELSLLFSDDAEIRSINQQWRKIDKPTNVISFPGQEMLVGEPGGKILGDLCFAWETIDAEAALEDKSFHHHLSHLVVHGFLHLFGYDHLEDEQAEQMESLETKILRQIGIDDPYGN